MQTQFLDTDSEEEQPLKKKQKVQCQQDCSDSIPSFPPPMPPWSQLKNSRYSQGSSGEATNGISVVEPQMTRATFSHNEFDESTIHKSGITSSTPVYKGGFFANFPDLHVSYSNPCLLFKSMPPIRPAMSPIRLKQPPKPPPKLYAIQPATHVEGPALSAQTTPPPSANPLLGSSKPPSKNNNESRKIMFIRRHNKLIECKDT